MWVGAAQYVKLFNDDRFWLSLYNTSYYVFVGVPLHLFFALLAALAVNMNLRGIHFFRTAYYVPSLTPVVGQFDPMGMDISHPEWGLANAFLDWIGLEGLYWLQDPRLAKPALIVMSFWSIGGQMVILLAGLKGIPVPLYEAASIDGANWWARFWRITLPLLTPALFFNLIIAIIGAFQIFTQAYIMTDGGRTIRHFSICCICSALPLRISGWATRRRWPGCCSSSFSYSRFCSSCFRTGGYFTRATYGAETEGTFYRWHFCGAEPRQN